MLPGSALRTHCKAASVDSTWAQSLEHCYDQEPFHRIVQKHAFVEFFVVSGRGLLPLLATAPAQYIHPQSVHMCRCLPSCTCNGLKCHSACETPFQLCCNLTFTLKRPWQLPDNARRISSESTNYRIWHARTAACSRFQHSSKCQMSRTTDP